MKIPNTTLRVFFQLIAISVLTDVGTTNAFVPRTSTRQIVTGSSTLTTTSPSCITSTLYSEKTAETDVSENSVVPPKSKVKEIGLLTFDLDDTLYPIATVVEAANAAFVTAMERYGFEGVSAFDIVSTGREVREELAKTDPEAAAGL